MRLSARVQQVIDELDVSKGIYYSVSGVVAEMLFMFASIKKAKNILEVGTGNGYSAIILGAAAREFGGNVITIERNSRLALQARKNIISSGLQDTVTVYPGSAYKIINRLPGPFDMVFFDATKQEYCGYFERVKEKISAGGILIADNVAPPEKCVKDFIFAVESMPEINSSILPFGSGLLVAACTEKAEKKGFRRMSPLNELISGAKPRIFSGSAEDVWSGKIFQEKKEVLPEMDGYEEALFKDEEIIV